MIELADRSTHRALTFLVSLDQEGYQPTATELDLYITEGKCRISQAAFQDVFRPVTLMLESLKGSGGNLSEFLQSVFWVYEDDGRLYLTDLGRSMQKALARGDLDFDESLHVVLDPDDPLVLARCITQMAKMGPSMLVDPYYRMDSLPLTCQRTGINRILTSGKTAKSDRDGLATAIESLTTEYPVEIRIAKVDLHDRHVIADDGTVAMLGTSLNGIGRSFSVFVELDDAASAIKSHYEKIWKKAKVLGTTKPAT